MASERTSQRDDPPRHSNVGWYATTVAILVAVALSNAFSQRANYAQLGDVLPLREPLVWEFSSVFMIGVLLPALAWIYRRFPFHAKGWYRAAIIHALATLPFSIIHVGGMVALRKLVYAMAGYTYHFGPVWSGWLYEYRKDFVAYWLIVTYFAAFEAWRYRPGARVAAPRAQAGDTPEPLPAPVAARVDRLVVRKLNREFILATADIVRLESDGNYVTVHANGTTYQLRGSLARWLQQLDRRRFVQIHRSQVVNIDHIREIQPWDHGDYRVVLTDGSVVNFSRRYRAGLEQLLAPTNVDTRASSARP